MTELEHIMDQVNRSFRGEAWHGPSLSEALDGVAAEAAWTRVDGVAHTIAELVMHLRETTDIVIRRMTGRAGSLDDSAFWPQVPAISETVWASMLAELSRLHDELMVAISRVDPVRLDQPFIAGGSLAFHTLLGQAQHNVYHAGQIAILKELVRKRVD